MLAVGFFFVLAGGVLLFAGVIGIFLGQLFEAGSPGQHRPTKKLLVVSAVGLVLFILGLLIAMTG